MQHLLKFLTISSFAFLVSLLSSCAKQPQNPSDPYESANRKLAVFNMCADKIFFQPLAKIYVFIAPNFVQKGVHNAFKNIFTTTTVANDVLQGKFDFAVADTTRIIINSTIGILGFFDVAKHMKLPYHYEDFGMTMASWGATDSPYFVVPILGPRTFRDAFGIPFDIATNPITYLKPFKTAIWVALGGLIDTRAQYLPADAMVAQSFDPYTFLRDAYLQNRAQMIANNNSMKNYREFQAQQLQTFAPALSSGVDSGVIIKAPKAKATEQPQPPRAYQPTSADAAKTGGASVS